MLKTFEQVISSGVNLQEFEGYRVEAQQKSKKNLMIAAIIGGVLAVIGIVIAIVGNSGLGITLVFVGVFVFFIYWAISSSSIKSGLKNKIFSNVTKLIDPSLNYAIGDKEFSGLFRKSGILKAYSSLSTDDVFRGVINNMPYAIGEVKAVQKSDKSSHTVFQGPFFFVQTKNNYPYTTVIPDLLEKGLGKVGAFLQKADLSRLNQTNIRIDQDPQFEKSYAVWTKDEGFARNILNDQLRNYLTGLASVKPVYLGLRENYLYLAIDNRMNLFEIRLKDPINEAVIRKFYTEFSDYYKILEQIVGFVLGGGNQNTNNAPNIDETPIYPPTNNF